MNKAKKVNKSVNAVIWYFVLFLLVASVTIISLEYTDFKAGRPSFIFNSLLGLANTTTPEDLNKKLIFLAESEQVAYRYQKINNNSYIFHFTMDQAQQKPFLSSLKKLAATVGGHIGAGEDSNRELFFLTIEDRSCHLLQIRVIQEEIKKSEHETVSIKPFTDKKPEIKKQGPALAAIIIDDLGYQDGLSHQLKSLGIDITAAVIPESPFAEAESKRLRQYGLETIIHLPMAARNNQNNYNREQMIFPDSSPEEITAILKRARDRLPFAVGLNNHMGSNVTARRDLMEMFLSTLAQESLFFIDSRTTTESVAYDQAVAMGIPTMYRDVFLDDVVSYQNTRQQLKRLMLIARQKQRALAIGHPHQTTFEAIRDSLPEFQSSRVKIVFASVLVQSGS